MLGVWLCPAFAMAGQGDYEACQGVSTLHLSFIGTCQRQCVSATNAICMGVTFPLKSRWKLQSPRSDYFSFAIVRMRFRIFKKLLS